MCSTAWPRSLPQFLLCTFEKGSWCFYHGGCSKVGILSFLFCQPIAPWLLPSVSVCALHVFHSLTTIPTAVFALSCRERQLMLLSWWLTKRLALSLFLPLFKKGAAHWLLPFASVCALLVFHSLATIPAAVSALSRWERQLMLLCRYLLKGRYSFFFILSTDSTVTPSLLLCLCSPCVPQLDHDPCRSFCFVPLRKAADASM